MKKLDWVKWEAGKFLGGVVGMSIEEIGVYSVVLNLIYDNDGPIRDDRERIARRCAMRPTSFEKVFRQLLDSEKLFVEDGLIMNEKAAEVLKTRSKVVEKWKENLHAGDEKVRELFNENKGRRSPSAAPRAQSKRAVESESVEKKERKKDSRPAAQDAPYPAEFEEIWKQYPRTKNTSKKKAHDIWRMLNTENMERVKVAVPMFAAAMRAEGRPEDKIPHMTTWLNGRNYETAAIPPVTGGNVVAGDWWKTAKRDQWERLIKIYIGTSDWRLQWGPAPGKPGCCVPEDLIKTLPYHLLPEKYREVS